MSLTVLYSAIVVLLSAILVLVWKIYSLRRALREIDEGLQDKLSSDTNTPISLSGLDWYSRKLASDLNRQIKILKREQQKYETKNDDIKTAVNNIAHDIRTPLTAIYGYLELFEPDRLEEKEQKWLGIIKARTDNLKELTEELFFYSLAYAEAEELKPEKICVNDELSEVLAGFYGAMKSAGIEPRIDLPNEKVFRNLDIKAFDRIISNLINNALKYSTGNLIIRLDKKGLITFCNNTNGMTSTDVGRLFERFYTVETAKGSTGLGLSIARMLTEKMKGNITAKLEDNSLVIELLFEDI